MEYNKNIGDFHVSIFSQGNFFPQTGGTVIINNQTITTWIEKNYIEIVNNRRIIKTNLVNGDLESILNVFFKAIKDIEENQNDFVSSNHLADYFFNKFPPVWGTYNNVYKSLEEIDLWNDLLAKVYEWERQNNFTIKKGTPFFFNVTNYLDTGNFDFAFDYTHKALEDDKIRGSKQNPNYDYHDSPAFLFASMSIEKRHYLYWTIRDFVKKLESFIEKYNNEFNENLSYQKIRDKFFSKHIEFEDEILYFTYLFITRFYQVYNIDTFELYDNEFAKMRNLNYILSFCILLDQIMGKKINPNNYRETFIRHKSFKLIEGLSNNLFSINDEKYIKDKVKFYEGKEYFRAPWLINLSLKVMLRRKKRLHPFNLIYTKIANKKIINTMLIYLLRNHGAHDLKLEYLDTRIFQEILKSLLFQMFIIIQELL